MKTPNSLKVHEPPDNIYIGPLNAAYLGNYFAGVYM